MLRSFRVENHKSIKGEVELLLMPVYDKARPVTPVTAIFGANAAGKSNVLDALRWMRDAVVNSFRSWEPERGVPRTPFKLDPMTRNAPSLFAVDLLLNDVRYMYGFTVDDDRVTEEWLYTYPHNRKRVVFVRSNGDWEFGSTMRKAKFEQVAELTPRNALFLTTAARSEVEDAAPVFRWFQQSLAFTDPTMPWRDYFRSLVDGSSRAVLLELVRTADLGIRDIVDDREQVEDLRREWVSLSAELHKGTTLSPATGQEVRDRARVALRRIELERLLKSAPLSFVHGEHETVLGEDEESFGTVAWLRILVHALNALEVGSALCVDEIDSSLHPRLTARLIELFRDAETNSKHAQLIFTTHDATLLGTSFGNEILLRDEVWFVEKDSESGATTIYPLSDFKPRKEENTERRYLGGSYGAVPAVYSESLVERYKAVRKERDAAA